MSLPLSPHSLSFRPAVSADYPAIIRIKTAAFADDKIQENLSIQVEPAKLSEWWIDLTQRCVAELDHILMVCERTDSASPEIIAYAWFYRQGGEEPIWHATSFPERYAQGQYSAIIEYKEIWHKETLASHGDFICLEEIAVAPEVQRLKIGSRLFAHILDQAVKERLNVLAFVPRPGYITPDSDKDLHSGAPGFFRKCMFEHDALMMIRSSFGDMDKIPSLESMQLLLFRHGSELR